MQTVNICSSFIMYYLDKKRIRDNIAPWNTTVDKSCGHFCFRFANVLLSAWHIEQRYANCKNSIKYFLLLHLYRSSSNASFYLNKNCRFRFERSTQSISITSICVNPISAYNRKVNNDTNSLETAAMQLTYIQVNINTLTKFFSNSQPRPPAPITRMWQSLRTKFMSCTQKIQLC